MLHLVLFGDGRKFRVFQVDEETKERRDISSKYRLTDLSLVSPDGERYVGFFFGEPVGRAAKVDEEKAMRSLRT